MTGVERVLRAAVLALAGAAGRVLGVPLAVLARARRGKPMHPRGAVHAAVLERTGSSPPWSVPWLDEPGRDAVLVRLSRGAGLPERLPDVLGLAVRASGPEGARVELLLSTTGRGRLSRLLPVPRRDPAAVYGSIMGYRSDAGTVRLAAIGERTAGGGAHGAGTDGGPAREGAAGLVLVLAAARGAGSWRPFGRLVLGAPVARPDPDVRFDAVLHPPPGLVADGPLARLRSPAYALARAGRDSAGRSRGT